MGKAQSKRSVDITTETKKISDEITEKMEKIEDCDKKEVVNGDSAISERSDVEKQDTEDVENDKDMTTEKDIQASGDTARPQNTDETLKDGGGSATAEEISPLAADDSIKKSKKEKVKKKWSFRSISFGKKDKQKPTKNEDTAENGNAAINGADMIEKDITEARDALKDESNNDIETEKTTDVKENGDITPQHYNGDQKNFEEKSNIITANMTNNTTTTERCEPVQNENVAVSSQLFEKTEKTVTASTIVNDAQVSASATNEHGLNNANGIDENINATEQKPPKKDIINSSIQEPSERTNNVSPVFASTSTNGEVVKKIEQNGDNDEQTEEEVVEKNEAQTEVNSNTDNIVSDVATLDSIFPTSINPYNVQIHVQDLNLSDVKPDNESYRFHKSFTDIEVNKTVAQPSFSYDAVSMTKEVIEPNKNNEILADLTLDVVVNAKKFEEDKTADKISPPPLPISSPPSQVSIFAFTNNNESGKDSIQTEGLNFTNSKLVEENQNCPSINEVSTIESVDSEGIYTTHNAKPNEKMITDELNEEGKIKCEESSEENHIFFHKTDDVSPRAVSQNEGEYPVASAMINEITEKAALIVTQKLECNAKCQQITSTQQCTQSNEKMQEGIKCNIDEIINENTSVVDFNRSDNKCQRNDGKEFYESDLVIISNASPELVPVQTNNIAIECSLDTFASKLMQPEEMMISLLKGKDNIDDEHLNPIKEFANDKDVKDITMAEIKQDFSVTCE